MSLYPLAVYTAEHGLAWKYPHAEIDFAALDACRKAFGGLPDFDAGEAGFEGVWVTPERVFAMRCRSVRAWDFRGRDATYLAVTWVPREEAATTDFEALLATPALFAPTHAPQPFFEADAAGPQPLPLEALPAALPDFASVGALVATLPAGGSATLRRGGVGEPVQVRVSLPKPVRATARVTPSAIRKNDVPLTRPVATPAKQCHVQILVAIAIACAVTALLALAAFGWAVWQWREAELELALLRGLGKEAVAVAQPEGQEDGSQGESGQTDVAEQLEERGYDASPTEPAQPQTSEAVKEQSEPHEKEASPKQALPASVEAESPSADVSGREGEIAHE